MDVNPSLFPRFPRVAPQLSLYKILFVALLTAAAGCSLLILGEVSTPRDDVITIPWDESEAPPLGEPRKEPSP